MKIDDFLEKFGDFLKRYEPTDNTLSLWCSDNDNKDFVNIVNFTGSRKYNLKDIKNGDYSSLNKKNINFGLSIQSSGGNIKSLDFYVYPCFDDEYEPFIKTFLTVTPTSEQTFDVEASYKSSEIFTIDDDDVVEVE